MSERVKTPDQMVAEKKYALLAGPARGLDLFKRMPEILKTRDWPLDPDLQAVLIAAVGLTKIGAGRTLFRRPPAAAGLHGLWPADAGVRRDGRMTARQIVTDLDLRDLLQNR